MIIFEKQQDNYIMDFDDFIVCDKQIDLLFRLKEKIKDLKVNLFCIVGACLEKQILELKKIKWINFCLHGETHDWLECKNWNEKRITEYLKKYNNGIYEKIFKAPYWAGNEIIYKVLGENDYIIAEQENTIIKYKKTSTFLQKVKFYCADENQKRIHGHMNNVCNNGLEEKFKMFSTYQGKYKFIKDLF